jgi:hypothetical protein
MLDRIHKAHKDTLSTASELMPVDDVVFYKRDSNGTLTFQEARNGNVANIWLYSFSSDGTRKAVGLLSQYEIMTLEQLEDNGSALVQYRHYGSSYADCVTVEDEPAADDPESCIVRMNAYKKP